MQASYLFPRPSERTLHVIDVENLLGSTAFDAIEVVELENQYRERIVVGDHDHFVIASSHRVAAATWFGWSPTRRLVRSGPSGADRALVQVLEQEGVAARYGAVVIASGDGLFAAPAAMLQARGCKVSVAASRAGTVSRRLAFAVRDITFLGPEEDARAGEVRLAA